MNERIKKLKEQATSYTWNGNDVTEELDEQKFAELIVRECVHVAQQWEDDCGTDYNSGRTWAGIDIMKHFGVEE